MKILNIRYCLSFFTLFAFALMGPAQAFACGGLFCVTTPVDQNAERIVFTVNGDQTAMITQIAYSGDPNEFSWVIPISELPLEDGFATVDRAVLDALDSASSPIFQDRCNIDFAAEAGGPPQASRDEDGGANVEINKIVDNYQVVVINAEDVVKVDDRVEVLVRWLRENRFQITDVMKPFIRMYIQDPSMKFLALRLIKDSTVDDIKPFRFVTQGAPSIPLRMTALAAEPEMGIKVWVFADSRYKALNWSELEINTEDVVRDPRTRQPNWPEVVSRANDEVGMGFVTEVAGPADPFREGVIRNLPFLPPPSDDVEDSPEVEEARVDREKQLEDIAEMIPEGSFMTRFYTRMSPEEMQRDPIFGEWDGQGEASVDRVWVIGPEGDCGFTDPDPCELVSCGAGSECYVVSDDGQGQVEVGCACVPGSTARAISSNSGGGRFIRSTPPNCADTRISYLNPGDITVFEDGDSIILSDPCVGVDCGNGECNTINQTPTCDCFPGNVAITVQEDDGSTRVDCVEPIEPVSDEVYNRRLPELSGIPAGRNVDLPDPDPTPSSSGSCAVSNTNQVSHTGIGLLVSLLLGALWFRKYSRQTVK